MGVYQVAIGAFPYVDQDPKALIPLWLGDLWRTPVLFIYLSCIVGLPIFVFVAMIALWRGRRLEATLIGMNVGVAAVFMLAFSPDYLSWLMD